MKFKTLILLLTVNLTIMANEKSQKGFEISKELTINVSAQKLWQLVGIEFEDAYLWASSVDHSVGKGKAEFEGATCSERYCDLNAKGFSKISEKIIKYNDTEMNFAYQVMEGMPSFVTRAANDWKVVAINNTQSKLIMKAEFEVKGLMGSMMKGMMKKKMGKLLDIVLNDAKVYVTTGKPSKIKQERIEQVSKKTKTAA